MSYGGFYFWISSSHHTKLSLCRVYQKANKPLRGCHLFLYPGHQHAYRIVLLLAGQFPARWDMVPLEKTAPATTPRGMLSQKDGMPPHRGLLAIVGDNGGSQPLRDEVFGMLTDRGKPFRLDIFLILPRQMKTTTEIGLGKALKQIPQVVFLFRRGGWLLLIFSREQGELNIFWVRGHYDN